MTTDPEPLPPAVAALPQSVRDAMGRAWGQAVVETLNRLATAPVDGKESVYDLGLEETSAAKSDPGPSPRVVMAEVR